MAMSAGTADDEPIGEMNTTPLIDVMLVLLVMFIITIPIQTHAVKIDLPANSPPTETVVKPDINKVSIDPAGTVYGRFCSIPKTSANGATYISPGQRPGYLYANGNPLMFGDRSGLFSLDTVWGQFMTRLDMNRHNHKLIW